MKFNHHTFLILVFPLMILSNAYCNDVENPSNCTAYISDPWVDQLLVDQLEKFYNSYQNATLRDAQSSYAVLISSTFKISQSAVSSLLEKLEYLGVTAFPELKNTQVRTLQELDPRLLLFSAGFTFLHIPPASLAATQKLGVFQKIVPLEKFLQGKRPAADKKMGTAKESLSEAEVSQALYEHRQKVQSFLASFWDVLTRTEGQLGIIISVDNHTRQINIVERLHGSKLLQTDQNTASSMNSIWVVTEQGEQQFLESYFMYEFGLSSKNIKNLSVQFSPRSNVFIVSVSNAKSKRILTSMLAVGNDGKPSFFSIPVHIDIQRPKTKVQDSEEVRARTDARITKQFQLLSDKYSGITLIKEYLEASK